MILALASLSLAFALPPAAAALDSTRIEELQLELELASLGTLEERSVAEGAGGGQLRSRWSVGMEDGGPALRIELWVLPTERFGFRDAKGVLATILESERAKDPDYTLSESRILPGAYGFSPPGWLGVHRAGGDAKAGIDRVRICGLLADAGYALEILCEPALSDPKQAARLIAFAEEGVRYTGPIRDPAWTEEELTERWKAIAPERVQEQGDLGVHRTQHYVILTNMRASGGTVKKFGKKMEERYELIRDLYPFEDLPDGRLLPIYLFQTTDQYQAFLVHHLEMSAEQARRTAGIAYRDFYSTSYAAPNDPVHLHEGVHQIFGNILRLNGGGSWFQEGVAEFAETRPNDRKPFRVVAKARRHVPLREFLALQSLIFSQEIDKKQGDLAGDSYLQANCLIEFLHEDKRTKKSFQEFVQRVGRLPRNDVEAIEAVIGELYGWTLEELEAAFLAYWEKR